MVILLPPIPEYWDWNYSSYLNLDRVLHTSPFSMFISLFTKYLIISPYMLPVLYPTPSLHEWMRQEPIPKELTVQYAKKKKSYQSTVSILGILTRKEVSCFNIRTLKEKLQVINRRGIPDCEDSTCNTIKASNSMVRWGRGMPTVIIYLFLGVGCYYTKFLSPW